MFMVVRLGGCGGGKEGAHGAEGGVIFIQLCGGVVFTLSAFALTAGDVFLEEFYVAVTVTDGGIPAGDEGGGFLLRAGSGLEVATAAPDAQGGPCDGVGATLRAGGGEASKEAGGGGAVGCFLCCVHNMLCSIRGEGEPFNALLRAFCYYALSLFAEC